MLPHVLKAEEVAKYLNISRSKAYALFKSEDFPSFTFGGSVRVKSEDFMNWLESRKQAV